MQKTTVFENTTTYTLETMSDLSAFSNRVVRKQTFSSRKIAMMLSGFLCLGIGIYCLATARQQTLGICLILIGILACIRGVLFKKLQVWGGTPAFENGGEVRHFEFLEDGIRVIRPNGSRKGCLYGDIMLHSENETYFLLMQNFQTAFLVRKDGFTNGNVDDFRQFLIKKTACRQFEISDTTEK